MAHPSDKMTRSKRGMRRAHDFLTPPAVATCPQCNAVIRPHTVCRECGTYRGREVLQPKN
jgi:large subunit ribosomal protein L32